MFRCLINRALSSSAQSTRVPQVKVANSRVLRAVKNRRHGEAQVSIGDSGSPVRFQPYPFLVTAENKVECVKKVLTPLYNVPYEEQLSMKESYCRNVLRTLGQELYKSGTPIRLDVKRLPCHVNKIVGATKIHKYRNKDELSIWRGHDTQTITAGYMIFPIGKHGDTVCVEPDGIDVITDETKTASRIFQEFIRTEAKLGTCFDLGSEGGWRRVMIRCNVDGELMVIGILSPRTFKVRDVLEERDRFKEFMVRRAEEEGIKLASLYYQPCPNNKCMHRDVPYELLHGSKTLIETIGSLKINISPESYIHNSTEGAEILYKTVKQTIEECFLNGDRPIESHDRKPLLLNFESGSGSMAMYLADMADVLAVDRNPQTIEDAHESLALNDINNVQLLAAQIEIVISRIVEKYKRGKRDIIAVCDLPNNGLHKNVIEVLRTCHEVSKIVLVVPQISSKRTMDMLIDLCQKARHSRSSRPFAPITATPVDTCPMTEAFQTVIALERLPD